MTSQVAPSQLIVSQPVIPKVFHGDPFEDAEDWLDHFERVANINQWNEAGKLRNVVVVVIDFYSAKFTGRAFRPHTSLRKTQRECGTKTTTHL